MDALLQDWREAQARRIAGGNARFVAEFGRPPDDGVGARAGAALGLELRTERLFPDAPEALQRYLLITVPHVAGADRTELFDAAALLSDALGGAVVEPDLGADHYEWDGARSQGDLLEGADSAFWCWAPAADMPRDMRWALDMLRLPQAWVLPGARGRKGAGVRVFQPDTGVVPGHRELPPRCEAAPGAVNLVEGSGAPPLDPMAGGGNPGHGTATGSVVASPGDLGMEGAAPACALTPVRALRSVAVFDQSRVAQAIEHARRSGAHVVTLSLGGVPSRALHAALRAAVADNLVVVAAAGNCIGEVVFPARYPEAIAVGGCNARRLPWRGSSQGPAVAFSAPAEFVPCAEASQPADPKRLTRLGQGTSFATALVAGVAACWLAHHGREKLIARLPAGRSLQDMFRNLARGTASPAPGLPPTLFGAGVIDAEALLSADPDLAFAPGWDDWRPPAADGAFAAAAALVAPLARLGGLEAAAGVLAEDPRHELELACLALDQARHGATRRSVLEGAAPPPLSARLAARLAAKRGEAHGRG